MGLFDQAARRAAKEDGHHFLDWVLREEASGTAALVFERWEDARRVRFPGDPERQDDVLAVMRWREHPERRYYLVVEIQTEPGADIVERMAVYCLLVRLEFKQGDGVPTYPPVGGVVLNLTGVTDPSGVVLPLPGHAGHGLGLKPLVRNLGTIDAGATLADIGAGKTGLCILPWIPLMKGGDSLQRIEEWKRLAARIPEPEKRLLYAALALTFAELTKGLIDWQKGLE
jgi:hypothetical protein